MGVYICRTVLEGLKSTEKVLKIKQGDFSCFKINQILLEAINISHPKNKKGGKLSLFHSYCDHSSLGSLAKGSHNRVVFIVCGLEQMLVCKHSDASKSKSLLKTVYPRLRCAFLGTLEHYIKAVGHLSTVFQKFSSSG